MRKILFWLTAFAAVYAIGKVFALALSARAALIYPDDYPVIPWGQFIFYQLLAFASAFACWHFEGNSAQDNYDRIFAGQNRIYWGGKEKCLPNRRSQRRPKPSALPAEKNFILKLPINS